MSFWEKIKNKFKGNTKENDDMTENEQNNVNMEKEEETKKQQSKNNEKLKTPNESDKKIKTAKRVCLGLGVGFVLLWVILILGVKKHFQPNGAIDTIANFSMLVSFGFFIAFFVLKRKEKKDKND